MTANSDSRPRSLSMAHCRDLKALIVDPNGYLREIVADGLRRIGIGKVVCSASTDQAYEACVHFKPNLVITDWDAGGMSGLDFTRSIRRKERQMSRETPVILLASQITAEQIISARQAGINELLLKPVSVHSLKSRIEEVVLRPRKFIDSRNYVGPCRRRKFDAEYEGPLRRLTDEPVQRDTSPQNEKRYDKLRAMINRLTSYVVQDNDDYRNMVRGLYKLLAANQEGIDALGDDAIADIWKSAQRYVEGVGMTPSFNTEVILRHFQAIAVIMDTPDDSLQLRATVVRDLERLVTKRIHAYELNVNAKAVNA